MTLQEAFNKMVAHLAAQGRRSMGPDSVTCKYRGENGLKCVVGVLLSDEVAYNCDTNDLMCGTDISEVWVLTNNELALSDMSNKRAITFYGRMQAIHDVEASAEDIKKNLALLAQKYDLDYSVVDKIRTWVAD